MNEMERFRNEMAFRTFIDSQFKFNTDDSKEVMELIVSIYKAGFDMGVKFISTFPKESPQICSCDAESAFLRGDSFHCTNCGHPIKA